MQSIKDVQELGRTFSLRGVRESRKSQPNFPGLRLLAGLFGKYGITSTPKSAPRNPRIDVSANPKEMETWRLDLAKLPGLLAPGQEMVNRCTLEMTNDKQKRPTYRPYVIPGLRKEPRRPIYPAHSDSLGSWRVLNGSRENPPLWTSVSNPGFFIIYASCWMGTSRGCGPASAVYPLKCPISAFC